MNDWKTGEMGEIRCGQTGQTGKTGETGETSENSEQVLLTDGQSQGGKDRHTP